MDPIALLKELVEIPSVFPHEQELSAYLEKYLRDFSFSVEKVLTEERRPNLVATFGEPRNGKYLGFYGHMDTVPPASDYVVNPYQLQINGDVAKGLGSGDMKGGIACILSAVARAAQKNMPVKVIFGVDEEDISRGAHDIVQAQKLSDVGFLIVAESGQVEDTSKNMSVGLGRKGRVVFEATVRGRAAHAAVARNGLNAISEAVRFVNILNSWKFEPHHTMGRSSIVVQSIHAEADSFSVPDRCTLAFSLLATPNVSSAAFLEELRNSVEAQSITMECFQRERPTPYGESYELNLSEPFYQQIKSTIFDPHGIEGQYFSSVADENVFAHFGKVPVLTLGPIGGGDHTKDEWVSVPSLQVLADSYLKIIELWNS